MTQATLYLLDTNIISDLMRNPSGMAAQRVLASAAQGSNAKVCTSIIVQCELLFGLRKRSSPRWLAQYHRVMFPINVLPLESAAAEHYANLRAQLELAGTPIGPNDTYIAAHALAMDATLVSADAEFLRVPGLRVENWLSTEKDDQNGL
jgi:tRNA(fMet)-specific endonuclease VapC